MNKKKKSKKPLILTVERKTWGFKPTNRVLENKKGVYNRQKFKKFEAV